MHANVMLAIYPFCNSLVQRFGRIVVGTVRSSITNKRHESFGKTLYGSLTTHRVQ